MAATNKDHFLQVQRKKPDRKISAFVRGPIGLSSKNDGVLGVSTAKLENSTYDSLLLNVPSRMISLQGDEEPNNKIIV